MDARRHGYGVEDNGCATQVVDKCCSGGVEPVRERVASSALRNARQQLVVDAKHGPRMSNCNTVSREGALASSTGAHGLPLQRAHRLQADLGSGPPENTAQKEKRPPICLSCPIQTV